MNLLLYWWISLGDDGIVHYNFLTDSEDKLIKIRSYYDSVASRSEEAILYRTYSHYDNFLHIETSTRKPLVGLLKHKTIITFNNNEVKLTITSIISYVCSSLHRNNNLVKHFKISLLRVTRPDLYTKIRLTNMYYTSSWLWCAIYHCRWMNIWYSQYEQAPGWTGSTI